MTCAIIAFRSLLFTTLIYTSWAKNYDEIIKQLKDPTKLIFDVTNQVDGKIKDDKVDFLNGAMLNKTDVRLSPLIFYRQKFQRTDKLNNSSDEDLYLLKINFRSMHILRGNNLGSAHHFNSYLPWTFQTLLDLLNNSKVAREDQAALIINVRDWNLHSPSNLHKLKEFISALKSRDSNAKVGMQYDHVTSEQCGKRGQRKLRLRLSSRSTNDLMKLLDVVILNIYIQPETFPFTYSRFRSYLRQAFQHKGNEFLMKRKSSTTLIYGNLIFPGHICHYTYKLTTTLEMLQKYYFYMLQFSVHLLNNDGLEGVDGLIMQAVSNSIAGVHGFHGLKMGDVVTTHLSNVRLGSPTRAKCETADMMTTVSKQFNQVTINPFRLGTFGVNDIVVLGETSGPDCNQPDSRIPSLTLLIANIKPPGTNFQSEMTGVVSSFKGTLWKFLEVNLDTGFDNGTLSNVLSGLKQIPTNVTLACATDIMRGSRDRSRGQRFVKNMATGSWASFIQDIQLDCGLIWNLTDIIVLGVGFDMSDQTIGYSLARIELKRQKFLDLYPEKSMKFRVYMVDDNVQKYEELSLYCRPEVTTLNSHVEEVAMFAKLHNISVEIKCSFDFEGKIGWWSKLRTLDQLNMTKIKFSAFVARNYPELFLIGEFPTDPCILKTSKVPSNGILFASNYSGCTLYMNGFGNVTLVSNELEILLQYTFHKFNLVEVGTANLKDLNNILDVLSKKMILNQLSHQGSAQVKIYIQVDYQVINANEISLDKFMAKTVKPTGIHFANWEQPKNNFADPVTYFKKLKESGVMIGLVLEDCLQEVSNDFVNLKISLIFHRMDYIVCNINHTFVANNSISLEMEKYLDTQLFIQKYFQKSCQTPMDMLFRLNVIPTSDLDGDTEHIEAFLNFLQDVSQYGAAYKIKTFIVSAFDSRDKGRFGWWKIVDFESLSNTSMYFDRESDLLGRKMWRPLLQLDDTEQAGKSIPTRVSIITMISSISLLALVFLLMGIHYKRRFTILSRKEVDYFLNGFGDADTISNLKFPKEYEISKTKILLLNLIGKGNFGLVYNANVYTDDGCKISVAVKTPHPGCSRETFKTMLAELKVLCYVGSHPHVLEFVGAYVKEIGKGTVLIATELCENGALQEYLRKLHSQLLKDEELIAEGISSVKLCELTRFSHEIALGMKYIADKKIIHGDLSTRNVLLDIDLTCKIGDFGLSTKIYENQDIVIREKGEQLPWRWMAIESLSKLEFTTKSDVWSYGVTLWEVFSLGALPYPGMTSRDEFLKELENGFRMAVPIFASEAIYETMKLCWKINPRERPTFSDLAEDFRAIRNTEYARI